MRVFINEGGKFYAADKPFHPNDAESTFPTPDMVTVLAKEQKPLSREEMLQKIVDLGNQRIMGTLVPEGNPDA